MKEIILDTETTGLSVSEDHRIVEIACIETEDLVPTKKVFYKLLNPEREVSEDAFKIHGYSYERLKSENKFNQIADEFIEFINSSRNFSETWPDLTRFLRIIEAINAILAMVEK